MRTFSFDRVVDGDAYFETRDPYWARGRFILDPYPTKEKLDGCWAEIVRRVPSIPGKIVEWVEKGRAPGALDFKWTHEPKVLSVTPYPEDKMAFADKGKITPSAQK